MEQNALTGNKNTCKLTDVRVGLDMPAMKNAKDVLYSILYQCRKWVAKLYKALQ